MGVARAGPGNLGHFGADADRLPSAPVTLITQPCSRAIPFSGSCCAAPRSELQDLAHGDRKGEFSISFRLRRRRCGNARYDPSAPRMKICLPSSASIFFRLPPPAPIIWRPPHGASPPEPPRAAFSAASSSTPARARRGSQRGKDPPPAAIRAVLLQHFGRPAHFLRVISTRPGWSAQHIGLGPIGLIASLSLLSTSGGDSRRSCR